MTLDTQQSAENHVDDAEPGARVPVPAPKTFSRKSIFLILFAALLVNGAIVLVGLPEVRSLLGLTYSMEFETGTAPTPLWATPCFGSQVTRCFSQQSLSFGVTVSNKLV